MIWKRRPTHSSGDAQWQQAWKQPAPLPDEKKQALLESIHQRLDAGRSRRRLIYISTAAAAAVLTAWMIRSAWISTSQLPPPAEWNNIATTTNKRKLLLSDGSVLWLAPHSSVRINPRFTQQRVVVLDKGTAFFTVTPDKAHPFSVTVNQQQVKVLGTAFAITVKDSIDLHLVVKEGAVALSNARNSIVVHGGEQVHTIQAAIDSIHTAPAITADWWLQQQARLFNIPLGELLDQVAAYYHVQLHTKGIKRDTRVTLTWNFNQPLEKNLAVLNQLTGNTIH